MSPRAHERRREQQSVTEDRLEHIHYFPEAMLPNSTTSQSGPTASRNAACAVLSGTR